MPMTSKKPSPHGSCIRRNYNRKTVVCESFSYADKNMFEIVYMFYNVNQCNKPRRFDHRAKCHICYICLNYVQSF